MTTETCRKCGAAMADGIALLNTMRGIGDFDEMDDINHRPQPTDWWRWFIIPAGTTQASPTYGAGSAEAQIFTSINAYRTQCGFPAYQQNTILDGAAVAHHVLRLRKRKKSYAKPVPRLAPSGTA